MRPAAPDRLFRLAVVTAALLAVPGCGRETASVSGLVTCGGRPVTVGSVILFCPDGQIFRGAIGPDGRYRVTDVSRGKAAVAVIGGGDAPGVAPEQPVPPPAAAPRERLGPVVPARYGVPEESGLSVLVDRDTVTFDITLEP